MSVKKIKTAVVQMQCYNGDIAANLKQAAAEVEKAARAGAELILLPELMPSGYIFASSIWETAETIPGQTTRWLQKLSAQWGVYLGTSFLRKTHGDLLNVFVLAGPQGEEAGRVYKQYPAGFEAFFMTGKQSDHYIDTSLGRIGVGICYECQLTFFPKLMRDHSVDLILMPHSVPAFPESFLYPRQVVNHDIENVKSVAEFYATMLGVPVLMSNKTGYWESPAPFLPFFYQRSYFLGNSKIVDSDGKVLARLGCHTEATIVEEITLDPGRKKYDVPAIKGKWLRRETWNKKLFTFVEFAGRVFYKMNKKQRKKKCFPIKRFLSEKESKIAELN